MKAEYAASVIQCRYTFGKINRSIHEHYTPIFATESITG